MSESEDSAPNEIQNNIESENSEPESDSESQFVRWGGWSLRYLQRLVQNGGVRVASISQYATEPVYDRSHTTHVESDVIQSCDIPERDDFRCRVTLDAKGDFPQNTFHALQQREWYVSRRFNRTGQCSLMNRFVPNSLDGYLEFEDHNDRIFCAKFSQSGDTFCCASPYSVRIFETDSWKPTRVISDLDTGWAIVDIDYSPDERWVAYSSWSNIVHLVNVYGPHTLHQPHILLPEDTCIFSVKFARNSHHLLAGARLGALVVYDLVSERVLDYNERAHDGDDVNTVCYLDDTSQVYASGGDDALIKIWDTRSPSTSVGVFVGHEQGITCVSSKNDGRYVLSNGKDQCMKLWDMRKITCPQDASTSSEQLARTHNFDYRYQSWDRNLLPRAPQDHSLMTFAGHSVFRTLIRCDFSPAHSTGQRFVYSACARGAVVIYDTLSGDVVSRLEHDNGLIRDVTWHPCRPLIMGAAWGSYPVRFSYKADD
eukprot:126594_1